MYKIIGADQKEYGPISADQIREWIAEGRLDARTQACAEGSQDWKPLGMFPEFSFGTSPLAAGIPPATSSAPFSPEEILARDYTLDIIGCVTRGWELFKANFVTLFLSSLVVFITTFALNLLIGMTSGAVFKGASSASVVLQQLLACAAALVTGPLGGGLCLVYLRTIRLEPTNISEIFIGFQRAFTQLFLGRLIPAFIAIICFLPYTLTSGIKINQIMEQMRDIHPDQMHDLTSQLISTLVGSLPALLLCMIPVTYVAVNFAFTLPLIIDKGLGFWPAMMTSWKMVHKHWFQVFALVVVVGLLNLAGGCMCVVGLLVAAPIGTAATMYAYETIFGRKNA